MPSDKTEMPDAERLAAAAADGGKGGGSEQAMRRVLSLRREHGKLAQTWLPQGRGMRLLRCAATC
ncbi:MAG: hypothetical protein JNJ78_07395 [Anaerolineae bacterium]|nr:hypothetical protein [Anaerolineae bacterium]